MLIKYLKYFLLTSFRRQKIDRELDKIKFLFKGKILDVGGGRKRGVFTFPHKASVTVVDVNKKSDPDVVAKVEKLPFKKNFFNVVKATELFEHVKNPERGIKECIRVLKPKGYFIFSMPFLYPIHADPDDFQRWTNKKIRNVLNQYPVKIKKFVIQGYYFAVLAEMIKRPISNWCSATRYLFYFTVFPWLYLLVYFDNKIAKKFPLLRKYHAGYLIVCQKNQ